MLVKVSELPEAEATERFESVKTPKLITCDIH